MMITVAQVAAANEIELLCLTYDLFLEKVGALVANNTASIPYKKDALKVLTVLIGNLDMSVALSHDLFDLYIFIQKLVIEGDYADAAEIMSHIRDGYVAIKNLNLDFKPTTQNAENIYAGFTYGRSSINEFVVGNDNRGYII